MVVLVPAVKHSSWYICDLEPLDNLLEVGILHAQLSVKIIYLKVGRALPSQLLQLLNLRFVVFSFVQLCKLLHDLYEHLFLVSAIVLFAAQIEYRFLWFDCFGLISAIRVDACR